MIAAHGDKDLGIMEIHVKDILNVEITIIGVLNDDDNKDKKNKTVIAVKGTKYSLSIADNAFVFVLPKTNADQTNFEIEY